MVAHRFSGDLSKVESRSAIVGLIDAQQLVNQAFEGGPAPPLELRDGAVALAALRNPAQHLRAPR